MKMETFLLVTLLIMWVWSTVCIYKLEKGKGKIDLLISAFWWVTVPVYFLMSVNKDDKTKY